MPENRHIFSFSFKVFSDGCLHINSNTVIQLVILSFLNILYVADVKHESSEYYSLEASL